jgi:4-alpha-glucanotransferase
VIFPRASGVLLHPTSLPGPHGIGELGPEAFRFADWLAEAGQTIWQVLPLGPVGYGESPYQLFSAFAGNPMLISLDSLVERGWLAPADLAQRPQFRDETVNFEAVVPWKTGLLRQAFETYRTHHMEADREELEAFVGKQAAWLNGYARFMALKDTHENTMWTTWDPGSEPDPDAIEYEKFLQFEFFRQWSALKQYCAGRGIRMMGDLPIYVAHDSADVWEQPGLFNFDAVAGVPPDYFSATGQLWGNPLYRWDKMGLDHYHWWTERLRAALTQFDMVRMDHFRGFEAYWAVPASETTAVNGQWIKGPGTRFFRALENALGALPVVAENLGVITPEVEAIRAEFNFPGMAVLQFAFGNDAQSRSFRPHNYPRNIVAYTGTHDNDTAAGWWQSAGGDSMRTSADVEREKDRASAYLCTGSASMNWTMIRTLMASVGDTVLFPAQDLLGLGSSARMNTPSTARGNWRWRLAPGALTAELAGQMREMTKLYER